MFCYEVVRRVGIDFKTPFLSVSYDSKIPCQSQIEVCVLDAPCRAVLDFYIPSGM
eukprot:m.119916 g.119916  ORF g.119916 m.119916 type:complete len:55 (+) comp9365_c1_seq1:926-1090(+)